MMIAPAVAILFTFEYLTLAGWLIAFKDYRVGLSLWSAEWTGLFQFRSFFAFSQDLGYLLRNTLVMNLSIIVVTLFSAFTFAILINEIRNKTFVKMIQTTSFFPFFISYVIVYSMMNSLFAVNSGAINTTLVKLGVISQGVNVLGDPAYSWVLIVAVVLWKTIGYNGVIFIAAIAAIPAEQYEAAQIDGANRWQRIWHITVPNLMPTLIILLIMNSGWILNSNFELFFLFLNATNWPTMEVLDMYIYRYGLQLTNYSYATAVGIMKSVISIALVLSVNMFSKRITGRGIM